jgi:regulator of sigma E protease
VTGPLGVVVTIVLFLVVLGSLVLIHELGHFVMARLAGIRVLEFGIGFPPRARVLRSRGETLYTLNWLPIGGFVKLEGEDGDATEDPRSFARARLPVKLIILVAGVAMNLLLSFLIFMLIAWVATPFVGARIADEPATGSPAAIAGLHEGDRIRAIDGVRFEFYGDSVPSILRENAGRTVVLDIDRADGRQEQVSATLRPPEQLSETVGPLGIGIPTGYIYDQYTGHDLPTAIRIGATETGRWFGVILEGLGDLVGKVVANPTAPPPVQGPIGIATQISDVFFGSGLILTLYVAGILSANLALVNILPFPPLDGGRMLMIVLKRIFGARISLRAEQATYMVGFVFLFAFLIWVSGFDLLRILSGGS